MALGPVGNAIYVNQQTPFASTKSTSFLNNINEQSFVAAIDAAKEQKEIQKVRPTEENQKINPDKEHQKQENDQKQREFSKKTDKQKEKKEQNFTYHLDIKV